MSTKKAVDCPTFNKLKLKKPKMRGLMIAALKTRLMLLPIICAIPMSLVFVLNKAREEQYAYYFKCTDLEKLYCEIKDLGYYDSTKIKEEEEDPKKK